MPEVARYPSSASEEYIAARQKLLEAEFALRNQVEEVAKLRRTLPAGGVMKDYTFTEGPADINDTSGTVKKTTLADLVADDRSLLVYHCMFAAKDKAPCSMCASFVDGLNGVGQHISQRVNFVIIAKAPIEQLRAYAANRGWKNVRILSSYGTTFNGDMHMESPEYEADALQNPAISVFRKDGDKVRHVYTSRDALGTGKDRQERGLDAVSPLWNALDLVPEGRGEDWYPENGYVKMAKE